MSTYYCRLCCINSKPEESLLFSKYITEMIQFFLPELDMKLVNNPILCTGCYDKLEEMSKFRNKCLEIQNNLIQMLSNNGKCGSIDLSTFLPTRNISSTDTEKTNQDIEIGESKLEDAVSSGLNREVENSLIFSRSSLGEASDQAIQASGSVIKKSELNILTSSTCDSSDTSFQSIPDSETVVTIRSSHKLKTVKNILDVKFAKNYCQSCKLPFKSLTEQILHLYSVHQKDGELYSCLLCRCKSHKLSVILKHYGNSHSKCVDLNASCFFCLTHKKNFNELCVHMSQKHNSYCKSGKYFCNSCDFGSRSYIVLRKHYFQSHDLICNYCLKYFDNISALNRHLRNHFGNSNRRKIGYLK